MLGASLRKRTLLRYYGITREASFSDTSNIRLLTTLLRMRLVLSMASKFDIFGQTHSLEQSNNIRLPKGVGRRAIRGAASAISTN